MPLLRFSPFPSRRQCCAGLQSIANMAAAIQAGYIDIGIAGGIEFFTRGEHKCMLSFAHVRLRTAFHDSLCIFVLCALCCSSLDVWASDS